MSGLFNDWLGTLRSFFRIGPPATAATFDVSGLTAPRTFDLPDQSGTIALTSDIKHYAPIANGDPLAPDLIYDDFGDVILGEVFPE